MCRKTGGLAVEGAEPGAKLSGVVSSSRGWGGR